MQSYGVTMTKPDVVSLLLSEPGLLFWMQKPTLYVLAGTVAEPACPNETSVVVTLTDDGVPIVVTGPGPVWS
jgi:hypothetical protein